MSIILAIMLTPLITVQAIDSKDSGTADLFKEHKFFLEVAGGGGTADISHSALYSSHGAPLLDYNIVLNSQNSTLRFLSLVKIRNQPEPSVRAASGRVAFEYAFLNWLGLGASYNYTAITIRNAPVTDFDILFLNPAASSIFLGPLDINREPVLSDFVDFLRTNIKLHPFRSADLELGFHLSSRTVDSYLRLGISLKSFLRDNPFQRRSAGSSENKVNRVGGLLGLRYALARRLYINMEAYGYRYNNSLLLFSYSADIKNTYGVRIGLGFAINIFSATSDGQK